MDMRQRYLRRRLVDMFKLVVLAFGLVIGSAWGLSLIMPATAAPPQVGATNSLLFQDVTVNPTPQTAWADVLGTDNRHVYYKGVSEGTTVMTITVNGMWQDVEVYTDTTAVSFTSVETLTGVITPSQTVPVPAMKVSVQTSLSDTVATIGVVAQ